MRIKKRGYASPKQPEQEIMTIAHTVSAFLAKYRKHFVIAVSALAGVIVLAAGYAIMKAQQEQKASPFVATAYEYYNPSNGSAGDYGKALDLYREVQKKYPNTESGSIGKYYCGNCPVNLGRPEEAVKAYQAFIDNYSHDKFLLGLVYQRLGFAYQGLGRMDDARKSFEQSEALLGPGVATVELARIYEAAGNKPEAEKKYKTVLDKLIGTSWAMDAMGKVQKIAPIPQPAAGKSTK